jgi:hypothetical protein
MFMQMTQAHAGRESGGGDSAAYQNGGRTLLDLLEKDNLNYFLPDTVLPELKPGTYPFPANSVSYLMFMVIAYEGKHNYPSKNIDDNNIADPTFFFHLLSTLDSRKEMLNYSFDLNQFGIVLPGPLRWAFTDSDLENIQDEGILRIPNPETKRQLAIQKDGLVVINKKEFYLLDKDGKVGLFFHEAVLRTLLLLNPKHIEENGTENVRTYTRRLLKFLNGHEKDVNGTYPAFSVREAYDLFNIKENSTYWKI